MYYRETRAILGKTYRTKTNKIKITRDYGLWCLVPLQTLYYHHFMFFGNNCYLIPYVPRYVQYLQTTGEADNQECTIERHGQYWVKHTEQRQIK
jgi:hypothetical protein